MTPHVAAVPGPNRRRLVTFAVWATLFWIAAACGPVFGQNRPALLDSFLARLNAADVFPGADRFGPVQGSPPVAPVFRGNERVGFAWLNSDFVDSRGYSSKPIHVVVALDNDGTIVGLKIVQHSEPILMVGVPEKRIVQSLNTYLGFNPVRARAAGSGPPKADIVSGATATVLILGESVVRSANRVARRLQLGTGVASAAAPNAPGASGAAASATQSGAAASATPSGAAASGAAEGRAAGAPPIARANARVVDPAGGERVRDLTGTDLRSAILALAAARLAISNDSGLLHVAAAIGTPTIGVFGPTSPWHWKPLNKVAAILEPPGDEAARERARTAGNPAVAHRRTADVTPERVLEALRDLPALRR